MEGRSVIAGEAWQSQRKKMRIGTFSRKELSLRAKRGNLLRENAFLFMRLPRHFVPRNDTNMRLLHTARNDSIKLLPYY
jgi:hypothetical protein